MDASAVAAALDRAESALDDGRTLGGTGFWRAVEAVKADPNLVEEHGARIARIDAAAFSPWPWIKVPLGLGTVLAVVVTVAALALAVLAPSFPEPWDWILFGGATIALLGATHGLGHLAVGTLLGIRFTQWFVASPTTPQPGVKLDYLSYLRAPARSRAWMHAAGAVVTKIVPFALIPLASALPGWVTWVLLAVGVAAIVTDITWSTKTSDWKKVRRELDHA